MFKQLKEAIRRKRTPEPELPPFELVPAAQVYSAFNDITSFGARGFTTLGPGHFARKATDDIVQVVQLKALKALHYAPWWGVSLSYLPELSGHKLRWHRTVKSARLDLYDEPFDFYKLRAGHRVSGTFSTSTGHGVPHMRETMQAMWSTLHKPIETWLTSASTLHGVLDRAQEQLVRGWLGPIHQPHPLLILALTYARLGRRDDAKEGLNAYLDIAELGPEDHELLWSAIESAV